MLVHFSMLWSIGGDAGVEARAVAFVQFFKRELLNELSPLEYLQHRFVRIAIMLKNRALLE